MRTIESAAAILRTRIDNHDRVLAMFATPLRFADSLTVSKAALRAVLDDHDTQEARIAAAERERDHAYDALLAALSRHVDPDTQQRVTADIRDSLVRDTLDPPSP